MSDTHEAARELVEHTLGREWDELAVAVHIEKFDPRFRVPGRRADRSSSSQHRVRRFVGLVVKTLHWVVVLAADLISPTSTGFDGPSTRTYRGQVRGPEGSSAVQFADVVRGEFWLVISASRLAAVKTGSSPPVIVVWSGVGSGCPQLDRDAGALRWPDGSSASFVLDTAEGQRLVAV